MSASDRSPKGFDAFASDYEAVLDAGLAVSGESSGFFAKGRVQWLARCLTAEGASPRCVLDFGCGIGLSTRLLSGLSGVQKVIGVDPSARCLEQARQRSSDSRVRFVLADDFEPKGDVDLVFCNGVFHHIPPEARSQTVELIRRALNIGGRLALWENNPWNPGTRYVMHCIPFDREAVMLSPHQARRLLVGAGLLVRRLDFVFFFPRWAAWLRRCEPWLHRIPLGAQYQVLAGLCGR